MEFSSAFISEVLSLDKALRSSSDRTPEPQWSSSDEYLLLSEMSFRDNLLVAESELEQAQKKKEQALSDLEDAGQLRWLLYEKGKPLETAIIEALRTLGFTAEQYKDGDSEFDAVFESTEGRLLGEAEGKDSKKINVDKLRQLSMNIHEDLEREDVNAPAKGILFGNGLRLKDPKERSVQFTDKCINAAISTSIGLVTTERLFRSTKYIADSGDDDYARRCREALIAGVGVVELPEPPVRPEIDQPELDVTERSALPAEPS